MTFLSVSIATFISVHVFFLILLFLIVMSCLSAVTVVSVCTASFHNTVISSCSFIIIIIIIIITLPSMSWFLEWSLCEIIIHLFGLQALAYIY